MNNLRTKLCRRDRRQAGGTVHSFDASKAEQALKYLGEMLNSFRNSSCRRTSSAAVGQTQASTPSGKLCVDAKRLVDAADHDEWSLRMPGASRKTSATLHRAHWRCRSRVGSADLKVKVLDCPRYAQSVVVGFRCPGHLASHRVHDPNQVVRLRLPPLGRPATAG